MLGVRARPRASVNLNRWGLGLLLDVTWVDSALWWVEVAASVGPVQLDLEIGRS